MRSHAFDGRVRRPLDRIMPLSAGTRLGSYEIQASLGAGGMGEVYRARDIRLQRDVAIKVLPEIFAADPERLARFAREAQVLASLNHPHIAQVYGLEQSERTRCIVMELVEGETLADRVARGPVPQDEVRQLALQLVDALEAAHERGIVHRDLKPANIIGSPGGTVKVLDFGLAKTLSAAPEASALSMSPTVPATSMPGIVLGTLAYMAPEQARGQAVDMRADIWAFGCVLYEMLTGRQAFEGGTAADVLARIVTSDPDWSHLPAGMPSPLAQLVRVTLTKDPRSRLRHIGDARFFLEGKTLPDTVLVTQPGSRRRFGWPVVAALVAALAGTLVPAALYFRRDARRPVEAPDVRFELVLPGWFETGGAPAGSLSLSPDGRRLAYLAETDGRRAVWVRRIDATAAATPLPGTENAAGGLFWSHDGRQIAFFDNVGLKIIDAEGGVARLLAAAQIKAPGSWNQEGVLLFSSFTTGGIALRRVAETGGEPTAVASQVPDDVRERRADGNGRPFGNFEPQFLPDGRHFLYSRSADDPGSYDVYIGSLDSTPTTKVPIGPIESRIRYASGRLLFRRHGALLAQPFDADTLAVVGEPVSVAEDVGVFAASDNGVLVYRKSDPGVSTSLGSAVWFDRKGKRTELAGAPGPLPDLSLSPDDQRAVFMRNPAVLPDIWTLDLSRGIPNSLTSSDDVSESLPVWSPDGERVVFASTRGRNNIGTSMYVRAASGLGTEELIFAGEPMEAVLPQDWSKTGYIVFIRNSVPAETRREARTELWALRLAGNRTAFPLVQGRAQNVHAQVRPGGGWMAYTTNQTGERQIVIQSFPETKVKLPVAQGGVEPRWNGDGSELFYLALDGTMMVVSVRVHNDSIEIGLPKPLFKDPYLVSRGLGPLFRYDVTADGQRFLVNTRAVRAPESKAPPPAVTAVVNWMARLIPR